MEKRLPPNTIQEVPLSERDRTLLRAMRSIGRGDGRVARGVGIVLLLLTAYMGWMCWESRPFDWSLLAATIGVGLFGGFVTRLGKRKKTTSAVFGALLEKGTKQIVKGRLEAADILANGALRYRINGVAYEVQVLFVQPYPFVATLDEAHILPTDNIALHLVSWAPGNYYRLQVDDGGAVLGKQVIGDRFLPQSVRHNLIASLLVSGIVFLVAVMVEWLSYQAKQVWFSIPEFSIFAAIFILLPALLAFNQYIRTRRRYKVITVAKGKVSEVLVAHALVGKIRVPLTWYTVGSETLQVGPEKPLPVGADVEVRYVEQPDGRFPLPVSIAPLGEG